MILADLKEYKSRLFYLWICEKKSDSVKYFFLE